MTLLVILSVGIIAISAYFLLRGISNNSTKLLLAALFLVTPILVYHFVGTPSALGDQVVQEPIQQGQGTQSVAAPEFTAEQLSQATNALEAQLKETPNDIEKLKLLANTYTFDERFLDAASIWQKISQLDNKPSYTLRQANMLTSANKGKIPNQANELVMSVLKTHASEPEALWLAGLYAAQNQDVQSVKQYWNTLLPLIPHERQVELQGLIKQLEQGGIATSSNSQPTPSPKQQPKQAKAPSIQTSQNIENSADAININLSISPELKTTVDMNATVFIFAKAVNGPPAPLAVKRLTVKDLPIDVSLTDADAMMPQFAISAFDEIEVSAKISTSGNAADKTNDIISNKIQLQKETLKPIYNLKFN